MEEEAVKGKKQMQRKTRRDKNGEEKKGLLPWADKRGRKRKRHKI